MSAPRRERGIRVRLVQVVALAAVFGLVIAAQRGTPGLAGPSDVIAAVGLLLLAGMLASELLEVFGLPHLTGYLLAGVLAGPHVLHLVDHETVDRIQPVNTLALALIALAGGAELRMAEVARLGKSLSWGNLMQVVIVVPALTITFLVLGDRLPFAAGVTTTGLMAIGVLWGILAVSRSPSATLGVLAQLRPSGPVTRYSLAFVMSSDVVVVLLLSVSMTFLRPILLADATMSLDDLQHVGHELLGAVALGTTLGLVLAAYLKLVGKHLVVVLLGVGFGMTEALRYLRFDPLLTFLVAGFVVENMTDQGKKLLHAVEGTAGIVFIVFFATAGAHLDVPLLRALWAVALALAGVRFLATFVAQRLGSALARDEPAVRRWGWSSMVSQAGLTLGLSAVIERTFPAFGADFRALAIATVAIHEVIGPVLFKFALDRAGESGRGAAAAHEAEGGAPAAHEAGSA